MPKKTSQKVGKGTSRRVSLRKMIEQSEVLMEKPDVAKRLLDELDGMKKAQKEELRTILGEEIERMSQIKKEELAKKKALLEKAQNTFTQIKKDHKRKKLKEQEREARSGEEAFAKDLLKKLDEIE